ncbi:hypothetical protein P6F35_gp66 [Sphingomonas phage vB_StuS_MMDA13]|uniref:Uncharacterized protein n=1 Tax=Sphingomonas phage vB_StuS_MMDA13 TaxID=2686378 RepID=A0A7G3PHQ7_9CAUD|nr:hypothetical protein P6F35_gp66 [Sphingomonas phage vB_StuS_MMDA13]QHB80499.1 hypothetical protein MMDA13_gp66 [Sphingomonas phage vB_StuS_MMDA13]
MVARKDLTGQKFGTLTVLSYSGYRKGTYYNVRCDCGVEKEVLAQGLVSGRQKTCGGPGCKMSASPPNSNARKRMENPLTGQRFERLLVGEWVDGRWECVCDCGNTTYQFTADLKSGMVKSCGCHKGEMTHKRTERTWEGIEGEQFALLTVVRMIEGRGTRRLIATCACGSGEREYNANSVISGNAKSCGCYKAALIRSRGKGE